MIWKELFWNNFSSRRNGIQPDSEAPTKTQRNLGILRTCRQLYNEAVYYLYKKEVLTFHISPRYEHPTWFQISNRQGAKWYIRDPKHGKALGFQDLPYEMLKQVKIEIGAPYTRDPGQLICLWYKVHNFVEFLSRTRTKKFSRLCVHLKSTPNNPWVKNGNPIKSVHEASDSLSYDPDFKVIFVQFWRLRNVSACSTRLPTRIESSDKLFLQLIRESMTQTGKGGSALKRNGDWKSNDMYLEIMDRHFCQLDKALDTLPGRTAAMMRLRRFSSWFCTDEFGEESLYINKLEQMTKSLENWKRFIQDPEIVAERYLYMRYYAQREGLNLISGFELRDKWWHKWYPHGIPRLYTDNAASRIYAHFGRYSDLDLLELCEWYHSPESWESKIEKRRIFARLQDAQKYHKQVTSQAGEMSGSI